MAIIINYYGDYIKLYRNVLEALHAAEAGIASSLPAFRLYSLARKEFFADYAYVIYLTGPYHRVPTKPDGFETRTMAAELLSLGTKWRDLLSRPRDLALPFRQVVHIEPRRWPLPVNIGQLATVHPP
jgi:hypothetical protein